MQTTRKKTAEDAKGRNAATATSTQSSRAIVSW